MPLAEPVTLEQVTKFFAQIERSELFPTSLFERRFWEWIFCEDKEG